MTNIMVIDINATTVYRIRKLLEGIPVEVITASTSYEAINRVGNLQSVLDMIIIDVNLGSEDGYELISRLKEINPNLVVIIATSINTRKSFIRAIRVGANDYILKPFDDEYVKLKLMAHIKFIEASKTLPTSSAKQIETSLYGAVRKAIRENHELLIGLILVYNKNSPTQSETNVRDITLIKGLNKELENALNLEDEVYSHGHNSFVIVLHKKTLSAKPAVIEMFYNLCETYFADKKVTDFLFELDFINLPNEIDPRQNAMTILAQRIENKMM